jgi:hypothetical protein
MGWREILNGMLNGPRGQRQPTKIAAGGGMSPIMMALLGYPPTRLLRGAPAGNHQVRRRGPLTNALRTAS